MNIMHSVIFHYSPKEDRQTDDLREVPRHTVDLIEVRELLHRMGVNAAAHRSQIRSAEPMPSCQIR